mmetsp:Transcript_6006/g.12866  ORF Transcript_6006/g.12866 Transcript_6006/m.12866 type:complete len:119 (+) Transcript_6006:30-386(+)
MLMIWVSVQGCGLWGVKRGEVEKESVKKRKFWGVGRRKRNRGEKKKKALRKCGVCVLGSVAKVAMLSSELPSVPTFFLEADVHITVQEGHTFPFSSVSIPVSGTRVSTDVAAAAARSS